MKVLQINCVYDSGSTGRLTADIHRFLLSQDVASLVCYGRGSRTGEFQVYRLGSELYGKANNVISRIRGTMYGGCVWGTDKIIRLLEKEKPDIVHLQCINGYFVNIYRLVAWLKDHHIKTVLTLHAEFMYTANCAHSLDCEQWRHGCGNCPRWRQETLSWFRDGTADSFCRMEAAFRDFEYDLTVVSVSDWLCSRAKTSPVLEKMRHRVIRNGVDTQLFTYRPEPKVKKERWIFHATALFSDEPTHLKGGYYLLELAKRMQDVPARFVVAGKYRLRGTVPPNVTLLGEIQNPEQLARLYSGAEVTMVTSRRETFSMVCAESQCCGTPVTGFLAGGPEEICLKEYASFVPFGDLDALEQAVRSRLDDPPDKQTVSDAACRHFSREIMLRKYLELYRGILHDPSC